MDQNWLDVQEKEFLIQKKELTNKKICQKYNINEEGEILKKLLIMVVSIAVLSWCNLSAECEKCKIASTHRGFWGSTWTCSNINCGYENYDGIDYCGLCGTRK